MKYLAAFVLVFGAAAMSCRTGEKTYEVQAAEQVVTLTVTGMT